MIIAPLTKESVPGFFPSLKQLSAQLKDDYWTLKNYELDLPEKWKLSHVLLDGNFIRAFVIASLKGNAIHINRLVVAEDMQAKGLGKRLLHLLVEKCAEYSLSQITLKVSIDNVKSINWYLRKGFLVVGKSGDYYEMKLELDDDRNTSA